MLRAAFVVFALGACGQHREQAPAASGSQRPPTPPDAAVPAPTVIAPHSNEIAVIAVGDRADVALTADQTGELRFWPSLDGSREPIVIHGRPANALAIASEHDGYVAALLDTARGIELLHLAKDGGLRSRQLVPAEPGFEEITASASALIARRSDHAIVRLDANTKGARTLAPGDGEQILAIAARRDVAVAGIADRERPAEIKVIRELVLADFTWGRAIELPVPLAPPIAISPLGERVAGLHARTGAGVIIDLGKQKVIASDIVATEVDEHVLGFLDDDRAVFRGGVVISAPDPGSTADPWTGTRSTVRVRRGRGSVIADGLLAAGHGTHLLLADPERTRFLGYRDLGVGFLRVTGTHVTLNFGNRVLWLDDKLDDIRARDVINDAAGGIAVDDHRLLKATYSYLEDDRSRLDLSLVDVVNNKEVSLGSWSQGASVAYDPSTNVFAVAGYTSTIVRGYLDLFAGEVKMLRSLKTRPDSTVEILDPKLADGAIAVAYSFGEVGIHVETFVDDGKAAPKSRPLAAASAVDIGDVVFPIGVDQTGTIWTLSVHTDQAKTLYAHRNGKQLRKLPVVDTTVTAGAVDRKGEHIALYSSTNLYLFDVDGKERWRIPAWSVNIARFTADGKTLLINTQGGLVALDVATGNRLATGCAWGFGMTTDEPQLTVFLAPVVCAEAS